MVVRENYAFQDVLEYAAAAGAWDAAKGYDLSPSLFTLPSPVGEACRACYELGYLLEKESNILYETAEHSVIATVTKWDDCRGYGEVSFIHFGAKIAVPFSYHVLTHDSVNEGDQVCLIFKLSPAGIVALSVKN